MRILRGGYIRFMMGRVMHIFFRYVSNAADMLRWIVVFTGMNIKALKISPMQRAQSVAGLKLNVK